MPALPHPSFPHVSRRSVLAATLGGGAAALLAGCASSAPGSATAGAATGGGASAGVTDTGTPTASASATGTPAATDAAAMVARANVPVLCWHQVREQRASDSSNSKYELICPPANFVAQLDAIAAAGWNTISPREYHDHVATGAALPDKPVLLTFDDGSDNQATFALPEVLKRGMKATLFIMTVVIDQKTWVTSEHVKSLAAQGVTIGSHTWDHHTVDKLTTAKDWETQLNESRRTLQRLTGQDVTDFCYPGGRWVPAALPHLVEAGYTTAFQLRETPVSPDAPLLTLRRQIVVSGWSGKQIVTQLDKMAAGGV